MYSLTGKAVMITGGTGSFGRVFVERALQVIKPRRLVVYSRDELKQFEMEKQFGSPEVQYIIGDVRDQARLRRALQGIEVVVHAAALKHVPIAENNPSEAFKTNVLGADNVVNAALDQGVERVIALSSDKAANPINVYGATKLCSDKMFVAGNALAGPDKTRFSVVRYGNVVASRGSVIPFFLSRRASGILPVTDPRMTRFWITLQKAVDFVIDCLETMHGGEIFVPKVPSMKILDLAAAIAPNCRIEVVGIRPGEKLHEVLVPADDARTTVELPDRYVIRPATGWFDPSWYREAKPVPEGFSFSSDQNDKWLSPEALVRMIESVALDDLSTVA